MALFGYSLLDNTTLPNLGNKFRLKDYVSISMKTIHSYFHEPLGLNTKYVSKNRICLHFAVLLDIVLVARADCIFPKRHIFKT